MYLNEISQELAKFIDRLSSASTWLLEKRFRRFAPMIETLRNHRCFWSCCTTGYYDPSNSLSGKKGKTSPGSLFKIQKIDQRLRSNTAGQWRAAGPVTGVFARLKTECLQRMLNYPTFHKRNIGKADQANKFIDPEEYRRKIYALFERRADIGIGDLFRVFYD